MFIVCISPGSSKAPEARKRVAPAVRPGVCRTRTFLSPGGAKESSAESYAPPGLKNSSPLNPGLTAGATLFRASGAEKTLRASGAWLKAKFLQHLFRVLSQLGSRFLRIT